MVTAPTHRKERDVWGTRFWGGASSEMGRDNVWATRRQDSIYSSIQNLSFSRVHKHEQKILTCRTVRMKRLLIVTCLCAFAVLCPLAVAGTAYVVTNDNNQNGNSATVYKLDTNDGTMTQVRVLQTGGLGMTNANASNVSQAITRTGSCVFVFDVGSSDISAFSGSTNYGKVGNYSNPSLASDDNGGSIALAPDDSFLFATYSRTLNLASWAVNPDCSLTLVGTYFPSGGTSGLALKVTPNGKYLVVSSVGFEGAELFLINQATGELTDVNYLTYINSGTCEQIGCFPNGIDITADSRFVVFGGEGFYPSALLAQITTEGLVDPQVVLLRNPYGIGEPDCPLLSSAGYRGSGDLYLGMGIPTGVLTAHVSEKPPAFQVRNGTKTGGSQFQGVIAVTGTLMVTALFPNQIGVFAINADGSLTQLNLVTDPNGLSLTSLSVYPNTR